MPVTVSNDLPTACLTGLPDFRTPPLKSSRDKGGDVNAYLAAAIKAGAQVIVTRNLKDFPAADLQPWDIEAKSPDVFVLDQVGINDRAVAACVQQIADSRTRPPEAVEDVLGQLERDGLVESVAALRTV